MIALSAASVTTGNVDAGDYDADGRSEVVFFTGDSETGKEAYVLFYDDFRNRVTWTYR